MFRIGSVQGITKYLLVCALTLSSECQAALNKVQYWGDDDEIYFFTTRRPYWHWFTDAPTYNPPPEPEGRTIFFVFLFISLSIILFIVCICRRQWKNERRRLIQVSGATVHPPPTTVHPATTYGYYSGTSRPLLAFSNVGYQNDSATVDVPPDYGTVAISDLTTTQQYSFPVVVPKIETPPPKYQEGCTFPYM